MGYIQFHTDGNGDDIPPSDAYVLGFVQGEQVYAVFDTDETDYYSCAATNDPYREEHLSDWISDGNVDAVKSSFPDWIAINQIDPALEVKNEIVAQVTIKGYPITPIIFVPDSIYPSTGVFGFAGKLVVYPVNDNYWVPAIVEDYNTIADAVGKSIQQYINDFPDGGSMKSKSGAEDLASEYGLDGLVNSTGLLNATIVAQVP